MTVRQNYYTVVTCAQAVQDVGGIRYSTYEDGKRVFKTARFNQMDVQHDVDGLERGLGGRPFGGHGSSMVVGLGLGSGAQVRVEDGLCQSATVVVRAHHRLQQLHAGP